MNNAAVTLETILRPSEDVVVREIEGEVIIVPLVAGIGDADDSLFSLNETGREIMRRLDGQRTLGVIVEDLAGEYDAPTDEIARDVLGLAAALMEMKIVCAVTTD